ncbi:hypothetical protein P3102_10560 [Amycolatopsis sp. QT-25]|uniref:hypothetical protein n=1 Tax=Amycolatopsis sp. QT-25 TaxID=3034022 RepID=UPI0023EBBFF8|nr:hypothetical protein [Amycolatopsis sp. QT-25]WET81616.1 hypothetical protein P3102_10560 [Amycolatopsis sp. QT-25]
MPANRERMFGIGSFSEHMSTVGSGADGLMILGSAGFVSRHELVYVAATGRDGIGESGDEVSYLVSRPETQFSVEEGDVLLDDAHWQERALRDLPVRHALREHYEYLSFSLAQPQSGQSSHRGRWQWAFLTGSQDYQPVSMRGAFDVRRLFPSTQELPKVGNMLDQLVEPHLRWGTAPHGVDDRVE